MKQITIVRHSKAEAYQAARTDFERVLTRKGRAKATLIASRLKAEDVRVDLMISSPAARAFETAQIYAELMDLPGERIRIEEDLYTFGSYTRAVEILRGLDDSINHVMLFGHNPTFTALAWYLCSRYRNEMPTSATVGLELPIDHWSELQPDEGRLLYFYTRRIVDDLEAGG